MRAFLRNLFFPPVCVGCRELIAVPDFKREAPCLCPACAAKWERETEEQCGICQRPVGQCDCVTDAMRAARIPLFRKVLYYRHGTRDPIQNRMVYRIKEAPDRRTVRFFAEQMAPAVREILALNRQGKKVELLACFEPAFRFMAEWWKQLYGESEGKEEKGLFPASVDFTADLHSMGQYIQQGERMLMETVVRFAPAEQQMVVPFDEANGDGLNFLAGKTMDFINRQAMDGTLLAHVEGGVPNIILNLDENNARTMGQLIYFFEYACGLSGYLLGVNPFDQPGVEAYKKNMFALLGKPGYEEMGEELRKRLR